MPVTSRAHLAWKGTLSSVLLWQSCQCPWPTLLYSPPLATGSLRSWPPQIGMFRGCTSPRPGRSAPSHGMLCCRTGQCDSISLSIHPCSTELGCRGYHCSDQGGQVLLCTLIPFSLDVPPQQSTYSFYFWGTCLLGSIPVAPSYIPTQRSGHPSHSSLFLVCLIMDA